MKKTCFLALAASAALGAYAQNTARLPEATVAQSPLKEEMAIGPYDQPEWTMARRFPTTRVYLQQPPGGMAVEQWVRSKFYDGDRAKHRVQQEFEIGLPHRLQADLYVNHEINNQGTWYYDNFAGELRYALADWGKIPGNPTVYGEYKIKDEGADVAEGKLLLGDELAPGWHWGVNGAYEWDLGGEETREYAVSAALSHTLSDRRLSLGIEAIYATESVAGARGEHEDNLNIGPSLQWRPIPDLHLDFVPLFGVTDDAPDLMTYIVLGYDFGTAREEALAPISTKSR